MMARWHHPLIVFFVLAGASCTKNEVVVTEPVAGELNNSTWMLQAFETLGGRIELLHPRDTIPLTFSDHRKVKGRASGLCGNYYYGVYSTSSASAITFDSLISSEALCVPESKYWNFFDELRQVSSLQHAGTRLYLYNGNRTKRMMFTRML